MSSLSRDFWYWVYHYYDKWEHLGVSMLGILVLWLGTKGFIQHNLFWAIILVSIGGILKEVYDNWKWGYCGWDTWGDLIADAAGILLAAGLIWWRG